MILFKPESRGARLLSSIAIGLGLSLALGLLAAQWAGVTSAGELIEHMTDRAGVRSSNGGRLARLVLVWVLAALPLVVVVMFSRPVRTARTPLRSTLSASWTRTRSDWWRLMLVVLLLISIAENLVLAGHAGIYVYDTNKLTLLLCLLVASVASPPPVLKGRLIGASLLVTLIGIGSALWINSQAMAAVDKATGTAQLWSLVQRYAEPGDLVASDQCTVRGAELVAARRNVVECIDDEGLKKLLSSHSDVVYVRSGAPNPAVERYEGGRLAAKGAP